jgi:hypothetical protein
MQRIRRFILIGFLGVTASCLLALSATFLSNLTLPSESSVTERLSDLDKARLAEATRLRKFLGGEVWPGWEEANIPIIVYNEEYAFLVGYPEPPAGWVMEPRQEARGGAWERVPQDDFMGQPYYRQRLTDAAKTPENFTVRVGDLWAATLQTKQYSFIRFVEGFGGELPSIVRAIFPYRLMWKPLGGDSEAYIAGLVHEAFHSYQGSTAYERFAQAENAARSEVHYPWGDEQLEEAWQAEMEILAKAGQVQSRGAAEDLARRFLEKRAERRAMGGLDPELVEFELQREWLEGLAKYAELSITRMAAMEPGYFASAALAEDPDFHEYASRERFWRLQFQELTRMNRQRGEMRFYYTGMAQAVLLDWLEPEWKLRAFGESVFLERMLQEAVDGS